MEHSHDDNYLCYETEHARIYIHEDENNASLYKISVWSRSDEVRLVVSVWMPRSVLDEWIDKRLGKSAAVDLVRQMILDSQKKGDRNDA